MQHLIRRNANKNFQQNPKKKITLDLYELILTNPPIYLEIARYLINYRIFKWEIPQEFIADNKLENDLKYTNFLRSAMLKRIKLAVTQIISKDIDANKTTNILEICEKTMKYLVQDSAINNKWMINYLTDFFKYEKLSDFFKSTDVIERVISEKNLIKRAYYEEKGDKEALNKLKKKIFDEIVEEYVGKNRYLSQYLPARYILFNNFLKFIIQTVFVFFTLYALVSLCKFNLVDDNKTLIISLAVIALVLRLAFGSLLTPYKLGYSYAHLSEMSKTLKAETFKEIANAITYIKFGKDESVEVKSLEEDNKQIGSRKKIKKQDESTGYKQQSPTNEKKQEHQNESYIVRRWSADYAPPIIRKKIKTRGVPRADESNVTQEEDIRQDNQRYLALILANARLPIPITIVWQIEKKYYEYSLGNPDIVKIWSNIGFRKANVKDDLAFIAMAIFEELAKDIRLAKRFHSVAQWGHAVGSERENGFVKTQKCIIKLKIVTELYRLICIASENKPIRCPRGYENSRLFIPVKFLEKKDENEAEIQALYRKNL